MNAVRYLTWPHATHAPEDIALAQQSKVINVHKDCPELAT